MDRVARASRPRFAFNGSKTAILLVFGRRTIISTASYPILAIDNSVKLYHRKPPLQLTAVAATFRLRGLAGYMLSDGTQPSPTRSLKAAATDAGFSKPRFDPGRTILQEIGAQKGRGSFLFMNAPVSRPKSQCCPNAIGADPIHTFSFHEKKHLWQLYFPPLLTKWGGAGGGGVVSHTRPGISVFTHANQLSKSENPLTEHPGTYR
jgi:hypothetical protein